MKAFRKVIALMLAVMMVSAFGMTAASAKAVVDKFEVIEFGIFNEAGTEAAELAAGKTITVKATLQRVSGANNVEEKATVYAAVYSGSELVDVQGSTKTYLFAGTTQENNLALTIPEGKENLTLRAFLWDGANAIKPLAKSSDKAEITGITIGGAIVENFDVNKTEYTVNLPAETADKPKVAVKATAIVDAEVSYNDDNNKATVSVDGKTYTINYTITVDEVTFTNVKWRYASDIDSTTGNYKARDLTKRYVLKNPPEALSSENINKEDVKSKTIKETSEVSTVDEFKELVSLAVADENAFSYFTQVPPELVGLNYIPRYEKDFSRSEGGDDSFLASQTYGYLEFTIDRDTDFYFYTNGYKTITQKDGGTYTEPEVVNLTGDLKYWRAQYSQGFDCAWNYTADYSMSERSVNEGTKLYKTTLKIPDGQNTAKFHLWYTTQEWYAAPFFYKIHDYGKAEANLTDVKYTYNVDSTSPWEFTMNDTTKTIKIETVKPGLDESKIKNDDGSYKLLKDAYGLTNGSQIKDYLSRTISTRQCYIYTEMPDKFVGMKSILIPYDWSNYHTGNPSHGTISFKTDKNIRVYISAKDDYFEDGGKFEGKFTFKTAKIDDDKWNTTYCDELVTAANEAIGETGRKGQVTTYTPNVYSYDIIVPDGEETATVTLKVGNESWDFYRVIYETID